MFKLAQTHPCFIRVTHRRGRAAAWGAALLIAGGCGAPEVATGGKPATPPRPVEAASAPPLAAPASEIAEPPIPEIAWTYAESPEDFVAVWLGRIASSARPGGGPDGLVPHVDAIMVDGASWGARAADIRLVYVSETRGYAHRVAGGLHPSVGPVEAPRATEEDRRLLEHAGREAGPSPEWRPTMGGQQLRAPVSRAVPACAACHDPGAPAWHGLLVVDFQEIPDD